MSVKGAAAYTKLAEKFLYIMGSQRWFPYLKVWKFVKVEANALNILNEMTG